MKGSDVIMGIVGVIVLAVWTTGIFAIAHFIAKWW